MNTVDAPSSATDPQAISDWLAASLNTPGNAHRQWAQTTVAGLALGRRFAAVRLADELVYAVAVGAPATTTASAVLGALRGPVIHAPHSRRFYALVPASPPGHGLGPHAEYLGLGCFLGVPRVGDDQPDELASYWFFSMARPGALCDPNRVLDLVETGTAVLSRMNQS
ncbi:hypothetical protein [Streptomyces sp. NPDC057910]|uniref:hypothetical protein n=1 Tax=Streptomyces sp. NPDC057910 TaxID=3346278 RepID=UPI0036E3F062